VQSFKISETFIGFVPFPFLNLLICPCDMWAGLRACLYGVSQHGLGWLLLFLHSNSLNTYLSSFRRSPGGYHRAGLQLRYPPVHTHFSLHSYLQLSTLDSQSLENQRTRRKTLVAWQRTTHETNLDDPCWNRTCATAVREWPVLSPLTHPCHPIQKKPAC